jgi:hypothetical protein
VPEPFIGNEKPGDELWSNFCRRSGVTYYTAFDGGAPLLRPFASPQQQIVRFIFKPQLGYCAYVSQYEINVQMEKPYLYCATFLV